MLAQQQFDQVQTSRGTPEKPELDIRPVHLPDNAAKISVTDARIPRANETRALEHDSFLTANQP
ncbi:hypothetical protein [Agromyces binzhouensis]|uniref:hypothetical protein n=1 Tax=Agromyces binzhouensis TaxID=1817495 RepID=UPI00363E239E